MFSDTRGQCLWVAWNTVKFVQLHKTVYREHIGLKEALMFKERQTFM